MLKMEVLLEIVKFWGFYFKKSAGYTIISLTFTAPIT